MKNIGCLIILSLGLLSAACTRAGGGSASGSRSAPSVAPVGASKHLLFNTLSDGTTMAAPAVGLSLTGPQVGMINVYDTFSVASVSGAAVSSATYNFGDGSPVQTGGATIQYAYPNPGTYTVGVTAQLADGSTAAGQASINVLAAVDGMECVNQLAISGPSSVNVGQVANFGLNVPSCMSWRVSSLNWSFGDGQIGIGKSTNHIYSAAGTYASTVAVYLTGSATPLATLVTNVSVVDPNASANGGTATNPGTVPTTGSGTVDPGSSSGVVNPGSSAGAGTVTPGTSGGGTVTPGTSGSGTISSGTSPGGTVSPGSSASGIGESGTAPSGTVTPGSSSSGTVSNGSAPGGIVIPGSSSSGTVPPGSTAGGSTLPPIVTQTYAWVSSGVYGACSANCGGSQQLQYVCQNNIGLPVDSVLCSGAAPTQTQVCDADPAAAAYTQSSVTTEQGGQSVSCPANQVGSVTQQRQVTTTTAYACINHQVALASSSVSNGAWSSVTNCQDTSTYRCGQDRLSPAQAMARYRWMLKCESRSREIHDFLANVDRYNDHGHEHGMCENSREVYATFMQRQTSCGDKTWIAPTDANADCKLPPDVYVAHECGVGGVTAGAQILAGNTFFRFNYTPVEQASATALSHVATLVRGPWIFGPLVLGTPVERWITQPNAEDHDVMQFITQSRREITVTPNHGMLDTYGYLRPARDYRVGDYLTLTDGRYDRIQKINVGTYHGKIYNVLAKPELLTREVVATNGFLNATANHEHAGIHFVNRRLFQRRFSYGACH